MNFGFNDNKEKVEVYETTEIDAMIEALTQALQEQINTKANVASPTFTGTPKAPTPANTANNTQLATTAFVRTLLDMIYPVGMLVAVPNPENGKIPLYGTWEKVLSTTYYVWDIDKNNGYPVAIWRRKS